MTTHPLKELFANRISEGLLRKQIKTCSRWAEEYRVMPGGPWRFDYHPWLRDIHDCTNETVVGMKSAQVGFTEAALNKSFYAIDIEKKSVLYLLPVAGSAGKFSASRFDPALELSPHLRNMFSDVQNVRHKRAGATSLFVRGTMSRDGMKSDPVQLIIIDELEEANQENVSVAFSRTLGQKTGTFQNFLLSTPSIPNYGIHSYYKDTNQQHYMFICPHCGKLTEFVYPDCLVITADSITDPSIENSYLICKECKVEIKHETKPELFKTARWVPMYPGRPSVGFTVSQLYSCMTHPSRIATQVLKGQYSPSDTQELYNSYLGMPVEVEGARLTNEQFDSCIRPYKQPSQAKEGTFTTMGVDVGKMLHYVVVEWKFDSNVKVMDVNMMASATVLKVGSTPNIGDIAEAMHNYKIRFCVVDSQPETRMALEFAKAFPGRVRLCTYATGAQANQIKTSKNEDLRVNVDRTSWLDTMYGRFKTGRIFLPSDISKEYRKHLTSLTRVYRKDGNGNPVGRYEKPDDGDDHFSHAQTYAEIALQLSVGLARSEPLNGAF